MSKPIIYTNETCAYCKSVKEQLTNLLLDFKKPPYSESRRALERVKTLNYHMNTAFGRLDQLLRQIENKLNIKEDEHKSTN
mgnify:CR=1 FL=1